MRKPAGASLDSGTLEEEERVAHRVCPVWLGYFLISPIRRLLHNPHATLAPYVREGMTVVDVGTAMGFFSIPLARMVGASGKVVCVDMQEGMLKRLEKRARKAGVRERMEIRLCQQDSLNLGEFAGKIDFALASAVVHEVPDQARLFRELAEVLKPSGKVLIAEPRGHVKEDDFVRSVAAAEQQGFRVEERPRVRKSWAVVIQKTA